MTPELHRRLDSSMSPFDGVCVHSADVFDLAKLRDVLAAAISVLSPHYPVIESFHDWHEHDGYIVESKPDSWGSLNAAIETKRTLFDSRDDDFEVRIAVCPTSFDWLLRYNIDSGDESDYNMSTCDFDLSVATNANSAGAVDDLLTRFPGVLAKCASRSWFMSNYGGYPPM